MKVFVTGATGFIGRRLVDRLLAEGVEVVALARNERHAPPRGVRSVPGDVVVSESLGDAGRGCDRLYHLAALITFDPRRRGELLRVNGEGTSHVLAAARRWDVGRAVVVSSACTLGISSSRDALLDEDSQPAPRLAETNPYMASKLAAEKEAARAASLGQEVVVVNPTTVYGPGDFTLNSGTLVARVARSALLPTPPGGSNVVDVDDVVDGIIAAGERGTPGRRYILGGDNLTFGQIFATIAIVVGRRPHLVPVPRWIRGPVALAALIGGRVTGSRFLTPQIVGDLFDFKYFSTERARQQLGWAPRHSFQKSIERAWAFYRQEGLL